MKRDRSLVGQEMIQGINRFKEEVHSAKKYDFFDSENEGEAHDLMEATLHAVYNRQPRQAMVQARGLNEVINYDRSLRAVDFLQDRGVNPKIFCFHEEQGAEIPERFTVKSDNFDWEVTELSESNEKIPVKFIRNVSALRSMGLKIDGIAVATPSERMPIKKIAKEEFRKAGLGVLKLLGGIMLLPFLPFFLIGKDPILLIRIGKPNVGSYYIEAGRWL